MVHFLGETLSCSPTLVSLLPTASSEPEHSTPSTPSRPILFFSDKFIYFWLLWVFIAACGLSLVAARRLLIEVASLVAEHAL